MFSSLILSRKFPVCLLFILYVFVHSFSMNAFLCLSFVVVSLQLPWLLIQNQVLEVHLGSSTIMDNGIMKILSNKCTAWFNSWFYAFCVFLGQHPTKTTADYFQWHQWSWLQIWLTFLALLSPIHEYWPQTPTPECGAKLASLLSVLLIILGFVLFWKWAVLCVWNSYFIPPSLWQEQAKFNQILNQ